MEAEQTEMRLAFVNGAPGVFISGIVWVSVGEVWLQAGISTAFLVLFLGGMLIMPLATLIARKVFGAPKLAAKHPLGLLGLGSTFGLFAGILVAYSLLKSEPQTVFPALATIIGSRYFIFRTIYAEPFYWVLAAIIVAVSGYTLLYSVKWPGNLAFVVGLVEIGSAAALWYRARGTTISPISPRPA